MNPELKRINQLAKISKDRELTEEEKKEQQKLRSDYVKGFRENVRQVLLQTKVVNEEGEDITPEKLEVEKQKKGER